MRSRRDFFKITGAAVLGMMVARPGFGQTAPTLSYSRSSDRSSPQPLAGATLTGTIYIFVSPTGTTLGTVKFYLNGTLRRSESNPPYDFAGGSNVANPFTPTNGSHTVQAEWSGGSISSTFTAGAVSTTTTTQGTTTTTQGTTTTTQPGNWVLTFSEHRWMIDGVRIHQGTAIEGLPRNVRLVHCISDFSDQVPSWDAEANTDAFIAALPTFRGYGIDAITINLQGGNPGSASTWGEEFNNSAFNSDGTFKAAYTNRLTRVLNAMKGLRIVPIVGIFHPRQDQILTSEAAVKTAVNNAIAFLAPRKNQIVVEAINEANSTYLTHAILKRTRIREVVKMFRDAGFHSGFSLSGAVPTVAEAQSSNIILLHGNNKSDAGITDTANAARSLFPNLPVAYNEDGASGTTEYTAARYISHLTRSFNAGVGWGYHDSEAFQSVGPVGVDRVKLNWEPTSDRSKAVLTALRDLT